MSVQRITDEALECLSGGWGVSPALQARADLEKYQAMKLEHMEKLINPPVCFTPEEMDQMNRAKDKIMIDAMGIPEDNGWSEDDLREKAKCILLDAERAGRRSWAHGEIKRIIGLEGESHIRDLTSGGRRRAYKTFCDLHEHIQQMPSVVQPRSDRRCMRCGERKVEQDVTRMSYFRCLSCGLTGDETHFHRREPNTAPPPPPTWVFPRGKFKGCTIREVPCKYISWMVFGRIPPSWEKYKNHAKKELTRRELSDIFISDPDHKWYTRTERDADLAEKRAHNREKAPVVAVMSDEKLSDMLDEAIEACKDKPKKERSFCSKFLWR